jgi:putative flippase GtrA
LTPKNLIERFIPFDKFIKFCVVGGLGTLLNLFILFAAVEMFGLWYIYGATLSFVIVITFNFSLNKIWTFKNKERGTVVVTGQYLTYVVIGGIGMAINIATLFILVEFFHFWYLLAELIAILVATLWNFQGTRYLVFKSDGAVSRE